MKTTQEKIRKTSKIIYIGMRIGKILAVMGAGLCATAMLVLILNQGELTGLLTDSHRVGNPESAAVLFPVMLGIRAVVMGISVLVCGLLERIFLEIHREGTPFSVSHVIRIKKAAALALILSILSGTDQNVETAILTGEPMILVGIEVLWILFAVIIYCLAHIFDYGCQLQQESDETL